MEHRGVRIARHRGDPEQARSDLTVGQLRNTVREIAHGGVELVARHVLEEVAVAGWQFRRERLDVATPRVVALCQNSAGAGGKHKQRPNHGSTFAVLAFH